MGEIIGRGLQCLLRCGVAGMLALAGSGCISSKDFWQKTMTKGPGTLTVGGEFHPGKEPALELTGADVTNAVTGTVTNGTMQVAYGAGLQEHARAICAALDESFRGTEAEFGRPVFVRPTVYLLRVANEGRTIRFKMSAPAAENVLPWLMVLTNAPPSSAGGTGVTREQIAADLNGVALQVFVLAHEATEMRLVDPREILVMGDVTAQRGFIRFGLEFHTRWFRDGLANYTALKVSERFGRELEARGIPLDGSRAPGRRMQPFTELARAREKVFGWDQDSGEDYYAASTALFLLMERHAGGEAIRAMWRELPEVKFPDRNGLLKMIEQKTGLDVRAVARRFQYPELGLTFRRKEAEPREVESVTESGWAGEARLQASDVVVAVNGREIATLLEFEWRILDAFEKGEGVALTVERNGGRYTTEAMPLRR